MTTPTLPSSWRLWLRQVLAITRLELRKCFRGRRLVGLALLNLAPVAAMALTYVVRDDNIAEDAATASMFFAVMFATYLLRAGVFFTSAALAIQLLRSEMLEKTMHYYLLAPVRRGLVVAGKFLAATAASMVLCGFSVAATYLLLLGRLEGGGMRDAILRGPALSHLLAYLGVTALGCIGYGAVFTLLGLLWRNPIIPVLALFGWESVLFLLPPALKLATVMFYLESLLPHRPPVGPLAFLAEPPSALASLLGLALFTAAVLALAGWRASRMEIAYSTD